MMRILFLYLLPLSTTTGFGFSPRNSLVRLSSLASTATATATTTATSTSTSSPIAIIGGGPAGLCTAIALAQQGKKVILFDKQPTPLDPNDSEIWGDTAKFYLIGLGARGQKALDQFGVWEGQNGVKSYCQEVIGRKDWSPQGGEEGVERIFTDRPYKTMVLPREKLVGVLYKHITTNFSEDQIELKFGVDAAVDLEQEQEQEQESTILCNGEKFNASFVVASDGAARDVAKSISSSRKSAMRVVKYKDDNKRIYKTLPIKFPKESWRGDINYSSRTADGRVNFDALPANSNNEYCGILLLKEDDPLSGPDTSPFELRELLDKSLPQFSPLVDDATVAAVAKKDVSNLPSFRYVKNSLSWRNIVVLGDAAHCVKPYFGLGANSALEDVTFLSAIMENNRLSPNEMASEFSRQRAGEAKALVQISRELDRPGALGFFSFVLPLILDGLFHNVMPRIIMPNVIAMLQRTDYDFRGVRRRKRQDR